MTINLVLSKQGIQSAIQRLQQAKENLEDGVRQTVEILTLEGAEIAQAADGEMAVVTHSVMDNTGIISATGETNLIAEFGAGDTTISPSGLFEHEPDTEVFAGSYSLLEGSKEYYETGKWHFGGREYTFVEARQGLLKAKEHIVNNGTQIAREVIKL